VSREGALVLNNLFLVSACATVFIGTLYPLALEALTGEKISVGAPFFNATFAPLFVPLLIAVPFGPLLAWKRGDVLGVAQRRVAELKPGQSISIRRYELRFDGVTTRQGPNYRDLAAHFTVRRHGEFIGVLEPAKRSFPSRGTAITQTALMTRGVSQLYLSLGD